MTRLFVRNIELPLLTDISVSANFVIADIRNPDKRNTDFTKTITIPGTVEVNALFQNIFDPNVLLNTFNPNKKESCIYYAEDNEVIKGSLQLLRCKVNKESGEVLYECNIFGRNSNIFYDIGDKFLTANTTGSDDLDFSTYNHVLNKTNVTNAGILNSTNKIAGVDTALVAGIGYRYGLIDYGRNNGDLSNYYVSDLRPQIFMYEILQKIFTKAGYTFSSTFLNSAFFKSIVFPSTEENIKLSQSDQDNSQFYARRNATQTMTSNAITYNGSHWYSTSYFPKETILFNEDNVLPYNDAGGIYGTGTGWFIAPLSKVYNITTIINYDIVLANTLGTATNAVLNNYNFSIMISRFDGVNWIPLNSNQYSHTTTVMPTLTLSGNQLACSLNISATAGEVYKVEIQSFQISFDLYTAGAILVTTGITTATINVKVNSQYYASLQDTVITEGATLEVNQCLPLLTKQKDILRDIIKTFNLYFEPSKTVENEIVIEPYETFFTGTTQDWTRLRDISKGEIISPMGLLDAKIYRNTFKADQDFWNKTYFETYKEYYGCSRFDIDNDFVKNENVNEVLFSPTPLIGNDTNGLIIPKFWKQDNGLIKGLKVNPRILIWGGVINLTFGNWTLKSASGDSTYNSYPYVGHLDNPYNPTFDLNFDNPKKVYYSSPNFIYNDNNLVNVYYKGQFNQITSKQSKVVTRWYNLSPLNIKNFSFRSKIFDDGQYYLVNQIKNYDPSTPKTTEVELLLLTDYSPHVAGQKKLVQDAGPTDAARQMVARSIIEAASNLSSGYRFAGMIAPVVSSVITTDITLNRNYHNKTIYIDASIGDIYLTWDFATMSDCNVTLIRVDATANRVFITDIDATVTVVGNSVPYDLAGEGFTQYSSMTITSINIGGFAYNIYIK